MRDLADPANPWHGMYHPWDEWLLANPVDAMSDEARAYYKGEAPVGWKLSKVQVTAEGYVLPLIEDYHAKLKHRLNLSLSEEEQSRASCPYVFDVGGVFPSEHQRAVRQLKAEIHAAYLPAIPRWLADNPPKWAMFLPDGRVVTLGALGAELDGVELDESLPLEQHAEAYHYRLYAAEGTLLVTTELGQPWWAATFAGLAGVLDKAEEGNWAYFEYAGYVVFRSKDTYEVVAVYDFTGLALPLDTPVFTKEGYTFDFAWGWELPLVRAAQRQ